MQTKPFPDSEAIVIKHLRTDQTIAEARVYGKVPDNPTWPLLTLHRAGGGLIAGGTLDRPIIHLDCWGQSKDHKQEARYLAAQAISSLTRLEGQHVSLLLEGAVEVGGYVTQVEVLSGPLWLPDPDTNRARYVVTVALTVK